MNRKILLALAVLAFALTVGVGPALADNPPTCPAQPCVYVDPQRTPPGNEDGSPANPYNTQNEGYAAAQAYSGGGYVIIKNPDGTWAAPILVAGATSGAGGLAFPKSTIYLMVAAIALSLLLAGWILQRRSRALLQ